MLSNLDLLNRDLVLLHPRTNVKSIDFAKTIKIFKIRRYINCGNPLKIFIRHKKRPCRVKSARSNLYQE